MLDGKYTNYYESGATEQIGNYVSDVLEGEVTTYYESGVVKSKVNAANNSYEGQYEAYYESGAKINGNYINGSRRMDFLLRIRCSSTNFKLHK